MRILVILTTLVLSSLIAYSQDSEVIVPDGKLNDTTYLYGVKKVNQIVRYPSMLNRLNEIILSAEREVLLLRQTLAERDTAVTETTKSVVILEERIKQSDIKIDALDIQLGLTKDELKAAMRRGRLLGIGLGGSVVLTGFLTGIIIAK